MRVIMTAEILESYGGNNPAAVSTVLFRVPCNKDIALNHWSL
jgi:hypothetical protein